MLCRELAAKTTFAFGHLGPLKFVQEFPRLHICKLKHPPSPRGIQIFYFVRNPLRINQKNHVRENVCSSFSPLNVSSPLAHAVKERKKHIPILQCVFLFIE
jgi:hypothetical protein